MRGKFWESWAATVIVGTLLGGGLLLVSLVANPAGVSASSWAVVALLTGVGVLAYRGLSRSGVEGARLRTAADQFPFGVVIYNSDLSIRFANRYAQNVYGKSPADIIGKRDSDLLTPETVRMFARELDDVLEDGSVRSAEARLESDGRRQMFMMTFAPVGEAGDEHNEILSVWFETSKIDEMTDRLERVNRTLSMLIDANRVLVGCDTEEELLARFCQILTEKSGYQLAWIGARSADGSIIPVAASGCEISELKQMDLRWDAAASEDIPIARAIRDGLPSTTRHTDEIAQECPPNIGQFGVKCCAGLPVRMGGEVRFGLCLCTTAGQGFDPEEMELLEQLAGDLAYGITSARARQRVTREEQVVAGMLELNQAAMEMEEAAMVEKALDLAIAATGSQLGCLQLMNDDQQTFRRGACSQFDEGGMESLNPGECRLYPDEPGCTDCVLSTLPRFDNRPTNPDAGPQEIHRRAEAPIVENGQVQARIAVAEKGTDYEETDLRLLQLIAENLWKTLGRRRMEMELKQNQALLSHAERIAHLGTWEYDAKTTEIRWSEETYRIHGWPQDAKLTLENLKKLIHPNDVDRVRKAVRRLVDTTNPDDLEYQVALPNGESRHLYVRGRAVTDSDGRFTGVTGTVLDITAQKAEEDKHRAFERMLVSFLDHLPAVITLKNEKLEHVYGNTAALELFHVDSEHFVGSTDTTFFKNDAAERLHAIERSALNTRQAVMISDIPVGQNGDTRHLQGVCFPVVLPDGQVQVGMYATDITELQSATAKSTLLHSALEAAANGVVITDTKGTIEWVNSAFTRITGYSAEEAIGNNPRLLKSGHHEPKFYKNMWATLKRGEVWNGELKNQRKDGTVYQEQMTITPVRDAAGKIAHFIAIKLDVTERQVLENKLLRSQRMESIGLLAGGVAHDLNNILAPIVMGVDLLRSTDLPPAEKNEFLDSIAQGCERGAGIIRQVLTFARGVEGDRVIVQPRHQVKDVVKMGRETFPKDINIRMDVSNNLWPVLGDPTQLHQVLLNFSVNARDAMPHGGQIEFIGENVQLAETRSFQGFEIPPGRYARLTVRDSGTGMPAEVLDRIFEPFFTTKEQGKGTGLGLPTVLGIVKSHQGLVEYQSAPGKGTSAIVWLPAAESTVEGREKPKTTPPQGHGETLLLVDDEIEVRRMTGKLLRRSNYQVLEAEDGAAAVALFATHQQAIDLVITDIMMPVMDGVALAHSLRKIDGSVKIVGSSGFVGGGDSRDRLEELKRAGVKTMLPKPYTPRELLETVAAELKENAVAEGI